MSTRLTRPRAVPWHDVRATLALALPLAGAQLSSMGMGVADVVLSGHLGAHVLGTVGVATAVYNIANMTAVGVNAAFGPAVARLDGAGQREAIGPLFRQALNVAGLLGLALMAAVYWLGPVAAGLLGFSPHLTAAIGEFLRAIAPAAPAISLFYCCRGLMEGLSRPRPTVAFSLLGLAVLVPVGYSLMYGPFGLPSLGARGCALATVVAVWAELLGFAAWLALSGAFHGLGWQRRRAFDAGLMGGLVRTGLPIAVALLLETSLFSAAGLAIGRFGEVQAAGHQVALNVAAFTFMVPLGIALATSVRVGNAAGRRDAAGMRRAGLCGMGLALAMQVIAGSLMLLIPESIAALYTSDPAVIAQARALLRIGGVFQLSDGLQVSAMGALRGLKDTRLPMLITGLAYWVVGFPLALLMAFGFDWQASGMWIGLIAGLTTAAALLTARFLRLTRPAE